MKNSFVLQTNREVLMLSGDIAFWNQGAARLELAGNTARINEAGAFTVFLKAPTENLIPVKDFYGISNTKVPF